MKDRTDELTRCQFENKKLLERIAKMNEGMGRKSNPGGLDDTSTKDANGIPGTKNPITGEIVVKSPEGNTLPVIDVMKDHAAEWEKYKEEHRKSQASAKFSSYIKEDMKALQGDVRKFQKRVSQAGHMMDDNERAVVEDLKKKGLAGMGSGGDLNEFGESDYDIYAPTPSVSDLGGGGKKKGKGKATVTGGGRGRGVGVGGKAGSNSRGRNAGPTSGNRNTTDNDSSDDDPADYVDAKGRPLPPKEIAKIKAKKQKEKDIARAEGREVPGRAGKAGAKGKGGVDDIRGSSPIKYAKDKGENLRRNSVVDENAVEGGKLIGKRSEAYTIKRGGVSIKVNDMGTGTEISGGDMESGITYIKPEFLAKSGGQNTGPDSYQQFPLPNVEAKMEVDPLTGAKIATFALKNGAITLKVTTKSSADEMAIKNGGLRALIKILAEELGIENIFAKVQAASNKYIGNDSEARTMATNRGKGTKGNISQTSMNSNRADGADHNCSIFASDIIDEQNGDGEMSSESIDFNDGQYDDGLGPVKEVKSEKQADGTTIRTSVLADGRIVKEVISKEGKVLSKRASKNPVDSKKAAERRKSQFEELPTNKKKAMDQFLHRISLLPEDDVPEIMVDVLKIFEGKGQIDAGLQKEIAKLPPSIRANITELAKELEGAGGVKLDMTKVSAKDQAILNEKPPPVRKLDALKKDKAGNLVDETGAIVVSAAQNEKLVKDKDGNMVDRTTGKVIFDNTGALVKDKQEAAKFVARRESVKKKIMEEQIMEHIKQGGTVDGLVLDKDGVLKQVAADGTLVDYIAEPEGGIDVEKLVEDAQGNMVDPNTGKVVIDATGNFVGESLADVKKVIAIAKGKYDKDSISDAINSKNAFNKKLNSTIAGAENLKTHPSGRDFTKQGLKH